MYCWSAVVFSRCLVVRAYFWRYPSCAPLSWGGTGANDKKREAWKCNRNAGGEGWEGGKGGRPHRRQSCRSSGQQWVERWLTVMWWVDLLWTITPPGPGIAVTPAVYCTLGALWGEHHWPRLISNLHTHHTIWYSSNWNDTGMCNRYWHQQPPLPLAASSHLQQEFLPVLCFITSNKKFGTRKGR